MSKQHKKSKVSFFKKYQRMIYCVFLVLWITSTILAWKAFRQPLQLEEKVLDNKILQKTNIAYSIEVIPCTLYPSGGTVKPEGSILTNITNSVKILVDSVVLSEKPVLIKGTQGIILKLKADGLWEREYLLNEKAPLHLEGNRNQIIQGEFTVKPAAFLNFIKTVEDEIKTGASKYYLTVKPILSGNIIYVDNNIPLDTSPELAFEIRGSMLTPVTEKDGEFGNPSVTTIDKVEFTKEDILENTKITPMMFNFLGYEMSPVSARYVFSIISLLIMTFVTYSLITKSRARNRRLTEAGRIDAKISKKINYGKTCF
jgi:hypothetical protein